MKTCILPSSTLVKRDQPFSEWSEWPLSQLLKKTDQRLVLRPNSIKHFLYAFKGNLIDQLQTNPHTEACWLVENHTMALVKIKLGPKVKLHCKGDFISAYSAVWAESGIASLYCRSFEDPFTSVQLCHNSLVINPGSTAIQLNFLNRAHVKRSNAQWELETRLGDIKSFRVDPLPGQVSKSLYGMDTTRWVFNFQIPSQEYTGDCVYRTYPYFECKLMNKNGFLTKSSIETKSEIISVLTPYMTNLILLNGDSISDEDYIEFACRITNTFASKSNKIKLDDVHSLVSILLREKKTLRPWNVTLKNQWINPLYTGDKNHLLNTNRVEYTKELVNQAFKQTQNVHEIAKLTGLHVNTCTKYAKEAGQLKRKTHDRPSLNKRTIDLLNALKLCIEKYPDMALKPRNVINTMKNEGHCKTLNARTAAKLIEAYHAS